MDYKTNAPAGAAMLDMARPEWFHKISRDVLDMRGIRSCVMGQLYGGYTTGLVTMFGPEYRVDLAVEYGFIREMTGEERDQSWETLTAEWLSLIGERLEAGKAEAGKAEAERTFW